MGEHGATGALSGITVIERAAGVAAAYAGRLLAVMGARVIMLEPEGGSPLRREPPFLDPEGRTSALFAYLAAGKRSMLEDTPAEGGDLDRLIESADILLDDTPLDARAEIGLDPEELTRRHPRLVFVSVLPFGAVGPHARWRAEEINSLHAGGEGALLPNGLALELFPDRPPVKIHGHFAMYQGGTSAATAAVAALMARPQVGGQVVDISVQDANLAIGAFAIQRLGEGVVENRRGPLIPLRRGRRMPRRLHPGPDARKPPMGGSAPAHGTIRTGPGIRASPIRSNGAGGAARSTAICEPGPGHRRSRMWSSAASASACRWRATTRRPTSWRTRTSASEASSRRSRSRASGRPRCWSRRSSSPRRRLA